MRTITTEKLSPVQETFLKETLDGLQSTPKFMHSKYFYDEQGDYIFQEIMNMDEYYLTDAEMDILVNQSEKIAQVISRPGTAFDLVELGAGDATKSIYLLKELLSGNLEFNYLPVDISSHVIQDLEENLPVKLPELNIQGLNGDYLEMLRKANQLSDRRKVVLFMGANIGNMAPDEALNFCSELRSLLDKDDILIIGVDLKKNPQQILAAYNDSMGVTSAFNLNLLERINKELGGNFEISNFEHYASYDPQTGACKSYLISLKDQTVSIAEDHQISFAKDEFIFMEISQKYSLKEIEAMASLSGFQAQQHFFDHNQYFVDSIWVVG